MYAERNRCRLSGTVPANSAITHAAIAAKNAAIVQSTTQMRCGIASSSRNRTVRRDRRRSSSTASWIGCSGIRRRTYAICGRSATRFGVHWAGVSSWGMELDPKTQERIDEPVSEEAQRETRLSPREAVAQMRIRVPERANRKLRHLIERVNRDDQLKGWWH